MRSLAHLLPGGAGPGLQAACLRDCKGASGVDGWMQMEGWKEHESELSGLVSVVRLGHASKDHSALSGGGGHAGGRVSPSSAAGRGRFFQLLRRPGFNESLSPSRDTVGPCHTVSSHAPPPLPPGPRGCSRIRDFMSCSQRAEKEGTQVVLNHSRSHMSAVSNRYQGIVLMALN